MAKKPHATPISHLPGKKRAGGAQLVRPKLTESAELVPRPPSPAAAAKWMARGAVRRSRLQHAPRVAQRASMTRQVPLLSVIDAIGEKARRNEHQERHEGRDNEFLWTRPRRPRKHTVTQCQSVGHCQLPRAHWPAFMASLAAGQPERAGGSPMAKAAQIATPATPVIKQPAASSQRSPSNSIRTRTARAQATRRGRKGTPAGGSTRPAREGP